MNKNKEAIRSLTFTTVRTDGQTYRNANIDMYHFWSEIHTNREEQDTDAHIWVPNVKIQEVVPETER